MNSRLEQDAADTMEWYDRQAAFRQSERERWARAQPPKIVGSWKPTMTEQQKQEHEQYVATHRCPF